MHCSVKWQHGGVIVCLYSSGTSLTGCKLFGSRVAQIRAFGFLSPGCLKSRICKISEKVQLFNN